MAIRKYKPTTPGRRGVTGSTFEEVTRDRPEKSLVAKGRNKAGRNTHGRVTARHQGGGNKRRYRVIDFRRGGGRSSRKRPGPSEHPSRDDAARLGAQAGSWRAHGPLGGDQRATDGQGGPVRHGSLAVGRDPAGRGDVPGDGRRRG